MNQKIQHCFQDGKTKLGWDLGAWTNVSLSNRKQRNYMSGVPNPVPPASTGPRPVRSGAAWQ